MSHNFEKLQMRVQLIKMKVEFEHTLATWSYQNGMNMPDDMAKSLRESIQTVKQELDNIENYHEDNDLALKAKRWDALMSCGRIRILGSAKLGSETAPQHIGLELWEQYPAESLSDSLQLQQKSELTKFVDTIIKHRNK